MGTTKKEGLDKISVWFIEPFGRGSVAYYMQSLLNALSQKEVAITLCTNNDYELKHLIKSFKLKESFPIRFVEIKGALAGWRNKIRKGQTFLKGMLELRKEISANQPEILHFQSGFVALSDFALYIFLRSFSSKSKMVYTAHNILPHEKRFYHPLIYRLIYRNASAVIVHGKRIKQEFYRVIGRNIPVVVIPLGNFTLYQDIQKKSTDSLREKLGLSPDDKVILFFGAIRPYKGLEVLIRAFRLVSTKLPKARLLIAGNPFGSFEPYRRLIIDMGLSEKTISIIGYIPGEEVAQYFAVSDVLALPYIKTYESGVTQLAYAFGVPVVASRTGGMAETVEDGKSGFLVPPGEHEPLAEALLRVLTDDELSKKLGQYSKELTEAKFSWDLIAEKTLTLYRNLCEEKSLNG